LFGKGECVMSIYTCIECDRLRDADFDEATEYKDGLICDDCCNEIDLDELPEIPEITLITRRPVKVKPLEDL